jgi:hypothetical protein
MHTSCDLCHSTRGYFARTGACVDCGHRPSDRTLAAHGSAWTVDRATGRRSIVRESSFSGEFGSDFTVDDADMSDEFKLMGPEEVAATVLGPTAALGAVMWFAGVKGWWWLTFIPLSHVVAAVSVLLVMQQRAAQGDAPAAKWLKANGYNSPNALPASTAAH